MKEPPPIESGFIFNIPPGIQNFEVLFFLLNLFDCTNTVFKKT